MKNYKLTFLFIIVVLLEVSAQNAIDHTYPKTDGPNKNPLKGWNSGWWNDNPDASVGFQYIKWKDFEPTNDNFNFDAVEELIDRPGSKGRHVILRLYADWFGSDQQSQAGPDWLYNDLGVARFEYGGKYVTDYNDSNYITQVIQAIEALASRYDNDPRIYTFQIGVLGYWGEWHTYSYDDPNFDIYESTQNQIINAYKTNFVNKRLMGRYPWRAPLSSTGGIGFHNDFFVPNNGHSDEFDEAIEQDNQWRQGPVGGEAPPIDDKNAFMVALYETSKGMSMIETGHYSTMKLGDSTVPSCDNPNDSKCQGYMALHRKMGYNFQIESAIFSENVITSDNLSVELAISNIGVAPMYYDWDVQFALLDQDNQPAQVFESTFDLRTILDGSTKTITLSDALSVGISNYQLAVRVIQPEADENKNSPWGLDARNVYILFSNEMNVIDGEWNSNNALVGGWSILGSVVVEDATLGVNIYNPLESSIAIFPNPSKERVTIFAKNELVVKSVQFHDMMGRVIEVSNIESLVDNKVVIDISNLSTGVYNLIISSDEGRVQKQFIKE